MKVEDQDVFGPGGTATFTCIYPQEVSSYVRIRKWFADKEPQEAEPSGNLVIHDVKESDSDKLYYCVIVNVLTKETLASNVAKIFMRNASGDCYVIFMHLLNLSKVPAAQIIFGHSRKKGYGCNPYLSLLLKFLVN